MLDPKSDLLAVSTPVASPEVPDLKEMIKSDPELQEFFRLIHQNDMRLQALELLDRRIGCAE